jgi:hypothetical protein
MKLHSIPCEVIEYDIKCRVTPTRAIRQCLRKFTIMDCDLHLCKDHALALGYGWKVDEEEEG